MMRVTIIYIYMYIIFSFCDGVTIDKILNDSNELPVNVVVILKYIYIYISSKQENKIGFFPGLGLA